MTIREQSEQTERQTLSPKAMLCINSKGRQHPEEQCLIRTDYQRDRDRVVHCKSYRRLMHKTQVFLSPEGDHYRTRLTHTQEVSQIARTVARALRLNEDLAEAIALGHDLGHTPFGHAGEDALNLVCPHGFVHSLQSVRVVEKLEKEGVGLNLTWEVRNGIACHSSGKEATTMEGKLVRYADKIAYMNHDIEDAMRARVLSPEDIPFEVSYVLGRKKSERITTLVTSLVENSKDSIAMSPEIFEAYTNLKTFLFEAVYTNPIAKGEEDKAKEIVRCLYKHYTQNTHTLPPEYKIILEQEDEHRAVCDYISGMSDRFAVALFEELYIPKCWTIK